MDGIKKHIIYLKDGQIRITEKSGKFSLTSATPFALFWTVYGARDCKIYELEPQLPADQVPIVMALNVH